VEPDRYAELERARDAVLAEAEVFRRELEPALAASLRSGFERICSEQAGHVADLGEAGQRAVLEAFDGAVRSGVAATLRRLEEAELWLSPFTAPDLLVASEAGWPISVPAWLATVLGRRRPGTALGALDDPANRVWVAIGAAAGTVDPVLQEFGFAPTHRRIGGGWFGVVPRTLPRLDPSGVLQRRWRRYRASYERYEALARLTG